MHDAIRYWEKASQLMDNDFHSCLMLQTCYLDVGDEPGAANAAQRTLERSESTLSKDPTNGAALAAGASSLFMAPSRTFEEQAVLDRADAGRGSAMDFSTGTQVPSDDLATTTTSGSKAVHAPRFDVETDTARDELLTEFGKDTLRDRYLLPGENYQDLFARVAAAYSDDQEHERLN